jgi:hypothetical protein
MYQEPSIEGDARVGGNGRPEDSSTVISPLRGTESHHPPTLVSRGVSASSSLTDLHGRRVGLMMEFTVVCDAPKGCVFDLARRKAPEH